MTGAADPRPARSEKRPRTAEDAAASERFKRLVAALDHFGCIVHDDPNDCAGPLQAHHVVSQQQLRRRGLHDLLWDVANGATVCEEAHRRHTLAVERIPFDRLPGRCVRFAEAQGLAAILARYYTSAG